jgi:tRNA(fMet)-specific endonuclease VapC
MPAYLLDTSVIIDVLNAKRGRAALLQGLLRDGGRLGCCAVNVAEVYAGMRQHEAQATATFLTSLDYHEITRDIAKQAGEIKFQQRRKGRTLSLADTMIAAVALSNGLILITDNVKDYPSVGLHLFELEP